MKTSVIILGCAGALSLAGMLRAADGGKLPPPADKQGVTYAQEIKPIFEAACGKCHGAEKPKAGLRLDSLEAVLKGSKRGKVLEPGKSATSSLVRAIARLDEEQAMPPKGKGQPLTPEQVGLVRAWIDQGAK